MQCIALSCAQGAGMAYPDIGPRIDIVQKKHKIDTGKLAQKLDKEKTTAWRWLQSPHKLSDSQQELLVEAICQILKEAGVKISADVFRTNNTLDFCFDLGISKSEAATITGRLVPVPDIFVESVFQPAAKRKAFVGSYLLFKHDKTRERRDRPYVQAYSEITLDGNDRLKYESWSGSEGLRSCTGFVVTAGTVTNIIGQQIMSDPHDMPEVFWCGLKRVIDKSGNAIQLYGYLSEVTKLGILFTDRVVLVRVEADEASRLRSIESHVSKSRAVQIVGENMLNYLDSWKDSSIEEPIFL
jgi:hypothetical protein